jgi:hypothetical protein
MSNPPQAPSTASDWQRWELALTQTWPVPEARSESVDWRVEAMVAGFVAAYSAVLGAVVGVIWPRVAPHIHVARAVNGSEAATKALLGDDIWLAGLGIVAGVVAVAGLNLVARNAGAGPGAAVGLAVGGILGSLVAAHVGHMVQEPHVSTALRSSFPGITHGEVTTILGYFGFRVRAKFVLFAWPIAAVAGHVAATAIRETRANQRRARDTGPRA